MREEEEGGGEDEDFHGGNKRESTDTDSGFSPQSYFFSTSMHFFTSHAQQS